MATLRVSICTALSREGLLALPPNYNWAFSPKHCYKLWCLPKICWVHCTVGWLKGQEAGPGHLHCGGEEFRSLSSGVFHLVTQNSGPSDGQQMLPARKHEQCALSNKGSSRVPGGLRPSLFL